MGGGYTPKFDPDTGAKILPFRVVSNDSHIAETNDLWPTRVDKQFRERAIHIESQEDGDWYYCDGHRILGTASVGTQPGIFFEKDIEKRKTFTMGEGLRFEDALPGGYDPDARMKDMDQDGIEKEVIYPTIGLVMWQGIVDSALLTAHCKGYNDYMAEFCGTYPDRLYALGTLNLDNVDDAVAELKRCHKLGLVGAMIPQSMPHRKYHLPDYEPLWATAADLGMPLSLHIETQRTTPEWGVLSPLADVPEAPGGNRITDPGFAGFHESELRAAVMQFIMSGVMERHSNLKVGIIELGLGWVHNFLQLMDGLYMKLGITSNRFKNAMIPSDFFHRQVFVGYQEDELGIQLRDIIGVDNIQWGSDYPHPEGTYPFSREILDGNLRNCSLVEKSKIAGANCVKLYHLDDR